MEEYENDKWRLIAAKVGSGFSPTACQEKAEEMEFQEEYEDTASPGSQGAVSAPGQPYGTSSYAPPATSAGTQPYDTASSRAISSRVYGFSAIDS